MISPPPVYWYDEIDSTSEEAKRRAANGSIGPVWIAARQQTAGRGRLGRQWQSPTGNLFATLLFPAQDGFSEAGRVPFAGALAAHDTCSAIVPDADIKLKWPNDVRVEGAKLSGMLVETGTHLGVIWIALGIGINVATAPQIEDYRTTSLMALGASTALQPEHVLEELSAATSKRLKQAGQNFAALLSDWETRAEALGQTVTAGPHSNRVTGRFVGLAEDGGLRLEQNDGTVTVIRTGEVDLVREVK